VIELIGLKEKADDRVKTLSGGQQRRLDVGLGIIGNPELLFLDEPTTGLDPSGRRDTWDLIRQLTSLGTTVMLTTHYMDEVEALADRVAVLNNAEIVAAGTPTSIGGRDSSEVTIRFLLPDGATVSDLPVAVDSLDRAWSRSAPATSCGSSTSSRGGRSSTTMRSPGSRWSGSPSKTSTCT
jgi:ABC-2 type transport system ATP-binding protein